jgi:hopanoid biosynthesis associated RND transporter like protein HpnN
MQKPTDSSGARWLNRLADFVYRYPRWVFYPHVGLFVLSIFYTLTFLKFDTSRNDLVGTDKAYHRNFLQFKQEFKSQDDLVAVVESEDMEKNRQFVERLGKRLEAETNIFTDVFYKGDLTMLGPKALLFLPEDTLVDLHGTLKSYRPFIQQFAQATNLVSLFDLVNRQFRTTKREASAETESLVQALPALERLIKQAADSLQRPGTPPSPGINALFNGGQEAEQELYITFANGQLYLVSARARSEDSNEKAVRRLRELVDATEHEVAGINVGITGEPVLEADEMAQSQRDTTLATVVSLLIVAAIFIYGYHETGRPIKATLCLICGLGFTVGYTTWTVGHLNILTITFAPMLIGLAIDFGVHLITRYEEELRHGENRRAALTTAIVFTGQGIFTGAFTTAGAFLAMALTDFKGVQEMGIITGGGLLVCLVPMVTLLPVLLLRGRQNIIDHLLAPAVDKRERLENIWLERPVTVVIITLALCAVGLTQFRKVYFDYNLLNMQIKGLPAVVYERKLIDSASKSVLYGAMVANSLERAVELEAKLTNLPVVASVDSMGRLLTENQVRKLELISDIKKEVAGIHFGEVDAGPVQVPKLNGTFFSLDGYLGLALEEIQKEGDENLAGRFKSLRSTVHQFAGRLNAMDARLAATKLAAFQQALFNDIRATFETIKQQDDRTRLRVEDLPPALRDRFVGRTGKFLLQVYPKEDVWQRENQKKFVSALRTIDPNVTGTPVQLYEYTTLLKKSYQQAAWYSLAAICVLVFVHFRSLTCVVLALIPVGIGAIWMGGLMGWLKIPFNPANIMTLPLVIGIGVTNGIHILNRYAEEKTPSILAKSTGKAVLVSGLTTIAGFGSLILAKHQGIRSLGYLMSIGVATCMIAALTFLPALLKLLMRAGWQLKKKKPSGDNARSTLGREEPR